MGLALEINRDTYLNITPERNSSVALSSAMLSQTAKGRALKLK